MSDNKNTFQNITISSDGISSARFTPKGMKRAVEQLIDEHKEFAEQARWGKEQLEVKEARIFELEGRLEAKERLLEEWGVDREKMVNKISELEMNVSGLKRDLDDWRADAQEWQDLMVRVGGNDTWTAQDIEGHYQMSPKGDQGQKKLTLSGHELTISNSTVPRVITAEELKPGQWVAWESPYGGWVAGLFEESDMQDLDRFKGRTIVLLADAPQHEPEPVKVGDTISSDARAAELPEGTILLDDDADPWRKGRDGSWRASDHYSLVHCTAEPVSYTNDPLTVLYLPEEDA